MVRELEPARDTADLAQPSGLPDETPENSVGTLVAAESPVVARELVVQQQPVGRLKADSPASAGQSLLPRSLHRSQEPVPATAV